MNKKDRRYTASQIGSSVRRGSSTIERSMVRTTQVTSYLFHAPDAYKTAAYIFIFTLFVGIFINFDINNTAQNFRVLNIYQNAILNGLVLIGFPALISGLISTPLAELLGGSFYNKRSFLMALVSTAILFVVMVFGKIMNVFFEFDFIIILIFGYALVFSIRHSVLLATSNPKNLNSIFASANHTVLGYIFLWLIPGTGFSIGKPELVYMLAFTLIFFIITLLWIHIVNTPFRRNFGVNGLLLTKHALTQFTKDNRAGTVLESEFFTKIGSNSDQRVGVVCIKSPEETSGSKPIRTLMVIPSVHPGPFGILGGSNLPAKLFKNLRNITENLMVFHGPAAHAQNLVATTECDKIARKVRTLAMTTEYSDKVSAFRRASVKYQTRTADNEVKNSNLTICTQQFGNGLVYIHTSAPEPTDDIDNPTGEAIVIKSESETGKKALFIDAHNCLEPGTGEVFFGSEKANKMLKLISKLNADLDDTPAYTLETGFAADYNFNISEGFGPMGIQVLVIRCESDSEKNTYAYILFDGNNMVSGLREQILNSIAPYVDDAEVFTTDNHIVNATMGGYNPVGLKIEPKRIIQNIQKLVKRAKDNLAYSEVGVNSGIVKNIRILGKNMPMRLSTTINTTIAIMKNSLIACQSLALVTCWLIALL
jgi:putative membrane protein